MAKWTQATLEKWLKNRPKELGDRDRHIYQQDNLIANVYASGNLTWYFYRRGTTNLKLGTYPAISLRQAKALVLKNLSDEFTGDNPDGRLIFKEYCNSAKFLREKNKTRKSNHSSMKALNNLIVPAIGHIRMDKLTLEDIDKFKFEYKAKNSSVNRLLNEIRAVLTHAHKNKAIKNNIQIENLKTDSTPDKRYLQESEINALRQASRERINLGVVEPIENLSKKQYLKKKSETGNNKK